MRKLVIQICTILLLMLTWVSPIYAEDDVPEAKKDCSIEAITKDFQSASSAAMAGEESAGNVNDCWMCNVVKTMVESFLKVAVKGGKISVKLGETILKYGFSLWLLYYLLTQVSATNPTKKRKMLQNILVMGFKVALALCVLKYASSVIFQYIIIPIVQFATYYGNVFLG